MKHGIYISKFYYLFLAVLDLHCCGLLSLVDENRGYSLQCTGFSLQWLLSVQSTGSTVCGLLWLQHMGSEAAGPGL